MLNNSSSRLPRQSLQQIDTDSFRSMPFSYDPRDKCERFKNDLPYIPFDILKQGNSTEEQLQWWKRTIGDHNVKERLNIVSQYDSVEHCNLTDNEQDRLRFLNAVRTLDETNLATQQEANRIANDMAAFSGSTSTITLASVIKVCCGFVAATLPLFLNANANDYFNR